MGNTNSTEGNNNLIASIQRRSRSSSSASIPKTIPNDIPAAHQPFQLSITEPDISEDSNTTTSATKEIPIKMKPDATPPPPATTSKGWVSSTGAASPWFGYLSSSASSHHRASISGPYYRTRGMSVTRDNETDEDLSNIIPAIASSSLNSQNDTPIQTEALTSPTEQNQTEQSQTEQSQPKSETATEAAADKVATTQPKSTASIHLSAPPTNQGVPTIITWAQGGNSVYVTGTFNGWKHKIKLVKSTHDFNAVLELPPGTHRLKFIVDDEWKCSNDMETATDPDGNLVNYLQVLDDDEENEHDEFDVTVNEYSNVIPAELLQMAAATDEAQKKTVMEWEKKQPQPPTLPPHLEKVLLNSNTVSEEDNSVLQEPNHVTLNHLYACSIKDNVMALATTSRYRKKYVTTMYYRPVFPKS